MVELRGGGGHPARRLGPLGAQPGRDRDRVSGQPDAGHPLHPAAVLPVERRPGRRPGADHRGRGRPTRAAPVPLGLPVGGRRVQRHDPVARPGRPPPLAGGRTGRRRAGRRARRAGLAALDRPGRPLQLLPGGGGRAGPRAGAGRHRPPHRHRRDDLLRRTAEQLRAAVHGRDGATPPGAPGGHRAGHRPSAG